MDFEIKECYCELLYDDYSLEDEEDTDNAMPESMPVDCLLQCSGCDECMGKLEKKDRRKRK